MGYPYLLEYSFGGIAELYFADKTFGVGVGIGSYTQNIHINELIDLDSDADSDRPDKVKSGYTRFAFIFRKNGLFSGERKTTFYVQHYNNDSWSDLEYWGVGILFQWNMRD